jgi:excinuclease ABC subunit B
VLVGINLLREGLDMPEVALVAILDADKEGFLRAERSLIQTCGRASRNVNGRVIMYADRITRSMKVCIDETNRRRIIQDQYNRDHGITPQTVKRAIRDIRGIALGMADYVDAPLEPAMLADLRPSYGKGKGGKGKAGKPGKPVSPTEIPQLVESLKKEMHSAADDLDFEKAAGLRDRIKQLEQLELALR